MAVHDMLMAAGGVSTGAATYVDDVFQTVVYNGTGGDQKISTSIPLADEDISSGVVLQMDCETLTDQCRVPTTLTFNGTSSLSTNYSKFGSKSLYTAPATSGAQVQPNHVSAPVSSRWTFGTNNFTIEFHIYLTGATASDSAIICSELPTRNWLAQIRSGNVLSWQSSPGPAVSFGTLPSYNEWHHVAYVRNGNELAVYVNGTKLGTTGDFTGINLNKIAALQIGSHKTNDLYLDNIRITNGTALYTSDFTPPSAPYPADTGTVPTLKKKKDALMWFATRTNLNYGQHVFLDTIRGVQKSLYSTNTNASYPYSDVTALYADGYKLSWLQGDENYELSTYVNWIFAKQKKFFDVVTYTGNGSTSQNIAHSLGSKPGCIIIKATSTTGDWWVTTRKDDSQWAYNLKLNTTGTASTWYPTSSDINASTFTTYITDAGSDTNSNGVTYVAYLFAHNAGGFGDAGTDNVISCGSFTDVGSGGTNTINLGYEPQWVLVKRATGGTAYYQEWRLIDCMRGMTVNGTGKVLIPNDSSSEGDSDINLRPNATGFTCSFSANTGGSQYIYIAIRRPMKPPTTGTEVFKPVYGQYSAPGYPSGFVTDAFLGLYRPGDASYPRMGSRLTGAKYLHTASTNAEASDSIITWDRMDGIYSGYMDTSYVGQCFKRAPGFFDVVCWTTSGTDVNERVKHNLTVPPELIIMKTRAVSTPWYTYNANLGRNYYLYLNTTAASASYADLWGTSNPTSTDFGINASVFYGSSNSLVAYLFATVAGVSKVGSYTGNGTNQDINCGFSGGARFVLIKRTDSTGDWWVFDTARGIVSGSDPALKLNGTNAENTSVDCIDPYAGGFNVVHTSTNPQVNINGASYIYLAIA